MQHLQPTLPENKALQPALRLPDFFIIGSAKCGTTTLYTYLCRHPNVFMSVPKEMSYFSKDEVYQRGVEWYADLFADAQPSQLCGEASTTYTRWPLYQNTVARLAAARPDARLLYIVRNPVDRLFSFYAHRMRENVTTSFENFLTATPEAVDSGRYMTQIKQYLEYFPEEQLQILFSQDLRDSPQPTLRKACQFLDLPAFDFLAQGPIQANEGGGKYFASASLTRSIRRLKRSPAFASLINRMPAPTRKAGYEWLANGPIGKRLRRRHQNRMSLVTPQQRQRLCELYRDEIEQLEEYTSRDLSAWKKATP